MLEHRNIVTKHIDLITQWCYTIFNVALVYFVYASEIFLMNLSVISNGLMQFSFQLVELCNFNLLWLNFHPVLEVEWSNTQLWIYTIWLWHLLICESYVSLNIGTALFMWRQIPVGFCFYQELVSVLHPHLLGLFLLSSSIKQPSCDFLPLKTMKKPFNFWVAALSSGFALPLRQFSATPCKGKTSLINCAE